MKSLLDFEIIGLESLAVRRHDNQLLSFRESSLDSKKTFCTVFHSKIRLFGNIRENALLVLIEALAVRMRRNRSRCSRIRSHFHSGRHGTRIAIEEIDSRIDDLRIGKLVQLDVFFGFLLFLFLARGGSLHILFKADAETGERFLAGRRENRPFVGNLG